MSLEKLIAQFGSITEFPVKVDTVRDWIIKNNYQDEIYFIPTDIDENILRGQFRKYTRHNVTYGDPIFTTNILYAESMNLCWERFVCCKEMMHIFDAPKAVSCTSEQIDALTSSLVSSYIGNLSDSYLAEHDAVISALRVLAPIGAIKKLNDAYGERKKSDYDIARYFRIPEMFVPILFSGDYQSLCDV